jgi:hypothetical protein
MIDFDDEAKLNQIGARFTVNNLERSQMTTDMVERMMFDRMRSQLAGLITREAVRVTEGAYHTEYETRLYVLTPGQLEKYVQRRAERIGYGRPQIIEQAFEPTNGH